MASLVKADAGDIPFWRSLDPHISDDILSLKFQSGQAYVLLDGSRYAGILRYGLFWDQIPFCNLAAILPGLRGQGFGRLLASLWESTMRESGYGVVLASSQSNEQAQGFWRHMGYEDCGVLALGRFGLQEPSDLVFSKSLRG